MHAYASMHMAMHMRGGSAAALLPMSSLDSESHLLGNVDALENMRSTFSAKTLSFFTVQRHLLMYAAIISFFAPFANLYQLTKLHQRKLADSPSLRDMFVLSLDVWFIQVFLKVAQINICTPIQEYVNPFIAFACMGVLQGFVYGQATTHFSSKLGLSAIKSTSSHVSLSQPAAKIVNSAEKMLRGSIFAGLRDVVSQGLPFALSGWVKRHLVQPWMPLPTNPQAEVIRQSVAVLTCSLFATVLSQGFHNMQTLMQSRTDLSYVSALRNAFANNGFRIVYSGAEARVGLLVLVNVLNELFLKKVWKPSKGGIVEVEDCDTKYCRACGTGTTNANRVQCKRCGTKDAWDAAGDTCSKAKKHSKYSKKLVSKKFTAHRFHRNLHSWTPPIPGHSLHD